LKEIVIISGKGGTGKTSIAASFSYLGRRDVIIADCDVDAADMHLLLQPDFDKKNDFYSGQLAKINPDLCNNCGLCADICRFDAIPLINSRYAVDPLECEGCGYCPRICPTDAITMEERNAGKWFISNTRIGACMVHARLNIGAENSGKLVAQVKHEAKRIARERNKDFVLVDGSPGIGCPVISSLAGADFVVLVTEPTISGLHDLKRVFELIARFGIPTGCIINKYDLNPEMSSRIEHYLMQKKITHIASLPYDDKFTEAMTKGQTIVEYNHNKLTGVITTSWEKVKSIIKTEGKQR
jgi:MinD superfamily P-loop ATPase